MEDTPQRRPLNPPDNDQDDNVNNDVHDPDIRLKHLCLNQCLKYQQRVSANINSVLVRPGTSMRHRSLRKFVPYFVDDSGKTPPKNEDARNEERARNSVVVNIKKWTANDRKLLAAAVQEQVLEEEIAPILFKRTGLEIQYKKSEDPDIKSQISKEQKAIDKFRSLSLKELLMKVRMPKINWRRISSQFLPRHTHFQCELQWFNVDHPNINYGPWSATEDQNLINLAQENKFLNWIAIARSLGVNRTPAQCLQRYILHHDSSVFKSRWTEDEDDSLKSLVKALGTTSWQQVASYMEGRTGQQCMFRWKAIDPDKRRGAFTKEEDQLLEEGIKKYGSGHWRKIQQTFLPWRTDIQIRDRWINVLDPEVNRKRWTIDEERKLSSLIQHIGEGKWSQISKEMSLRTDNQCRRKWISIQNSSKRKARYQSLRRFPISGNISENSGFDQLFTEAGKDTVASNSTHLVEISENLAEKQPLAKRSSNIDTEDLQAIQGSPAKKQSRSDESLDEARGHENMITKESEITADHNYAATTETTKKSAEIDNSNSSDAILPTVKTKPQGIPKEAIWDLSRLQRSIDKKLLKLTDKYSGYLSNKGINFPPQDKDLYEKKLQKIKSVAYQERAQIEKRYLLPTGYLSVNFNVISVNIPNQNS
ncbi:uncharacterized protein TRIADDRAFT_52276 [Trichoplax adhaerens]|uniref:Uncharacterized protein n=1 Tax=Trichoplax adhaerens TaxID=10228 RepID=B3RM89_TRIAD|nr:hypothetical protein TRIADDRAFT_52276 [Trichoplax adhaerens]EDV28921.1 hypothetical protein TRIADDRAFT_52276 [Trichoplax adhaerens]|eukprot:XP_002108123.1 hypothetical protein TRIADDRAFT_52276 [Trichoplax adhaerens]